MFLVQAGLLFLPLAAAKVGWLPALVPSGLQSFCQGREPEFSGPSTLLVVHLVLGALGLDGRFVLSLIDARRNSSRWKHLSIGKGRQITTSLPHLLGADMLPSLPPLFLLLLRVFLVHP